MIYDCFTFFNELDVLEIRMRELAGVVDRFVIVEATQTHKGEPKPLHFAANRARYRPWGEKIVHIVVSDLPAGDGPAAIWRREMTQRQCILRGLMDADDDDIVLVSDCDEIPRAAMVPQRMPDDTLLVYDQTLSYYNVNTVCTNLRWRGTRATTAANARAITPDGMRWSINRGDYPKLVVAQNGGWHLSYLGDVAHIQAKMNAFLHQELVNETTTDPAWIADKIARGLDVWGRGEQEFVVGPASDLPTALRCDPQRYQHLFHPEYAPRFTEDWCPPDQAHAIGVLARMAPRTGAHVEIGSWEGRSTVALAQAIAPTPLHAVDHWRGNEREAADHISVIAAQARNVEATFRHHVRSMTAGNVIPHVQDWRDWLATWHEPIAFLYLDAEHDEASVRDCLLAIQPQLVPGAIVCGDDFYVNGVDAGVRAVFGERAQDLNGRLWAYQHGDAE